MNYVMSDMHGDYEKYTEMLRLIGLREEDTLFVLGDVIDRGTQGMKILQDMMLRANVIPILGNHEYMASMAIPWLLEEVTEESISDLDEDRLQGLTEWISVGGESSLAEFHKLSKIEQEDILDYLAEFELYCEVEAGGKQFVLVHAGLNNFDEKRDLNDYDVSELIFAAPDLDREYFKNKYIVFGHVPTRTLYAQEEGVSLEEMQPSQYRDEVFAKGNLIGIDCGCGYGGRLGCICLETMQYFYV